MGNKVYRAVQLEISKCGINNRLYWYMYALNNPLRFVDPSGYKYGPTDYEREIINGEHTYYNWEMAWKMAGMMGSQFGSSKDRHPSGGWEFFSHSGDYRNIYTGERLSAAQFDAQFLNPVYMPGSADYSWGKIMTLEVEGYDLPINVYGKVKTKLASSQGGDWTDAAATGLFIFGQVKKGASDATKVFQASNMGILRAAVNNDLPTGNIKDIMRTTSRFGNGLKWAGIAGNSAGVILTGINIYNEGWTLENSADLFFNGVAFVPGYGWAISLGYTGAKWWINDVNTRINNSSDGGASVIESLEIQMMWMHCFVKGTQVLMGDESKKKIESIQIGDTVLTYNFSSKKLEAQPVLRVDAPINHKFIRISFSNGEEIISTEDHPYYVKDKGWCSFNPEQTSENYGFKTGVLEVSDFCLTFKR